MDPHDGQAGDGWAGVGMIRIRIRETDTRRYVGAEWANGCLHMHADINSWFDVRLAERLAKDLGVELDISEEACQALGPRDVV